MACLLDPLRERRVLICCEVHVVAQILPVGLAELGLHVDGRGRYVDHFRKTAEH